MNKVVHSILIVVLVLIIPLFIFSIVFGTSSKNVQAQQVSENIVILAPVAGEYEPGMQTFRAGVNGTFSSVQFYLNDEKLGPEIYSLPYSIQANLTKGTYRIAALGKGPNNLFVLSPTVTITVGGGAPEVIPTPDYIPEYVPEYTPAYTPEYTPTKRPVSTPSTKTPTTIPSDIPTIETVKIHLNTPLNRNLKLNDTGDDVKIIKEFLVVLGYEIPSYKTAVYDKSVQNAVFKYQEENTITGIVPSGNLDNATRSLIVSDIKRLAKNQELKTAVKEIIPKENIKDKINSKISAILFEAKATVRYTWLQSKDFYGFLKEKWNSI